MPKADPKFSKSQEAEEAQLNRALQALARAQGTPAAPQRGFAAAPPLVRRAAPHPPGPATAPTAASAPPIEPEVSTDTGVVSAAAPPPAPAPVSRPVAPADRHTVTVTGLRGSLAYNRRRTARSTYADAAALWAEVEEGDARMREVSPAPAPVHSAPVHTAAVHSASAQPAPVDLATAAPAAVSAAPPPADAPAAATPTAAPAVATPTDAPAAATPTAAPAAATPSDVPAAVQAAPAEPEAAPAPAEASAPSAAPALSVTAEPPPGPVARPQAPAAAAPTALPEADTEPKTEADTEAKTEADTEAKTEADTEAKAEAQAPSPPAAPAVPAAPPADPVRSNAAADRSGDGLTQAAAAAAAAASLNPTPRRDRTAADAAALRTPLAAALRAGDVPSLSVRTMADQAALAAATASSDRPRRHPAARAAKTADVREPTGEAPVLRPVPRRADPPVARDGHAATREGTVVRLITGLSDSRSDRSVAASANDVTTTGNAASWPDDAQDQPRDTLSPGALAQLDRLLTYLERRDRTLLSLVEMLVERNRQDRASVEELRTALARIEEMLAHQRRKTAPTTPTASSSVGRTG